MDFDRSANNEPAPRIGPLHRNSHRSNLRNLPSQQQEYFAFFNSVWGLCACRTRWSRRGGRGSGQKAAKGNEDRSGIKFPSRSSALLLWYVCPSANALCPPVFISLSASWPSVVPGVCLYIFTSLHPTDCLRDLCDLLCNGFFRAAHDFARIRTSSETGKQI